MTLRRTGPAIRTTTPRVAVLAALALSACSHAPGEPQRSLNESRLDILKGSAPGITVIPAATAASAPQSGTRSAMSGLIAPPSGRPLREATRLDSPSYGIPLPTAPTPVEARKAPAGGG